MAEFLPFTESYLLRLIYYTVSEPPSTASEKGLWYKTHTALVRVTNTGHRPLSKCDLERLALSIPELNHRVTGYRNVPLLLYPILIRMESQTRDCSIPQKTRSQLPSSSHSQLRPQTDCQTSAASPAAKPTQHPLLASSESNSCLAEGLLRCDGSFTVGLKHEEWTPVSYRDHDFIRSICPVYSTDDDVGVVECCSVSDYTAYGQPVLSVHVDLLCEDRQAVRGFSGDSMTEGQTRDQRPVRLKQKMTMSTQVQANLLD